MIKMEYRGRRSFLGTCVGVIMISCCIAGVEGDIPDGVVYTDVHKTVQNGYTAVLKCEFYGVPIAVYWKKGEDPRTSQNLITWAEGEPPSGSCVHDRSCEMNDQYSLIIRNTRIPDQGRYICRISNYLGILIHNNTDLKIYAPPKEPFPSIDECVESESSTLDSTQICSVLTNGSIVFISCTVRNYYPDLDLFFLHGSHKITDAVISEVTNVDGTKNRTISIKVSPSETPYVCVASDIPGSNDQRATTILVKSLRPTESTITPPHGSPTSSITKGGEMNTPNDNKAAKIAVSIVLIMVFIVGVGIALFLYRRQKRQQEGTPPGLTTSKTAGEFSTLSNTEEQEPLVPKAKISAGEFSTLSNTEEQKPLVPKAKISGDISFHELWSLAYDTREDDKLRIHHVLTELGIKHVTQELTPTKIYDFLCKWKEEHKIGEQKALLKKALQSANFESRWIQLCEQRNGTDSKVSHDTVEQLILEIENLNQIQQFLGILIPNRTCTKPDVQNPLEEVMKEMTEWNKGPFKENPFASLSLALERSGCSALDRTFFGGMVSFFEVWSLIHYLKDDDMDKRRSAFEELKLVIEDKLTVEELYNLLCSWKDQTKKISQGKSLRDALYTANLEKRWKEIHDLRRGDNTEVSQHMLEHILWHIKDPKKIDQFLQRLTLNDPGTQLNVTRGLRDIIKEAVTRLQIWTKKRFDENPLVLLSLALEKTGCCPIDRTFFKVPEALTQEIDEVKVQSFVDSLTSRHIKALTKCLDTGKTEDTLTKENKETMFNTDSMISGWIAKEECSNYEKKWKLNKAVDSIGRQDLKEFFGEMKPATLIGIDNGTATAHTKDAVQDGKIDNQTSDFMKEEYQRIGTYLSPSQIKNLFGHVGDSGDPRSAVQSYAGHRMAKRPKKDVREKLREKLKSVGFQDLIPSELKHNVYLCELLDVAFRLLLEDVYPLAKALGISDDKLQEYRFGYTPDHLTKGTSAALIKFSEANDNDRSKVCQALSEAEYTDIAQLLEYGHETSLADEFAVTSAASNKEDKEEVLTKITKNLGMNQSSSAERALREWRSMIHPPSYNHRKSLADAVFQALGADVAISILSGKYRENGSQSSSVIQTIASGIESLDLHLIAKILDVKNARKLGALTVSSQNTGFTEPSSTIEEGESKQTETDIDTRFKTATALKIAKILGVAVLTFDQDKAILQVIETWEEGMRKNPLSMKDRRDLSDKLLQAGFKEFAFEIMAGFVPRPKGEVGKGKKDEQEHQTHINQGKKDGKGNQVKQQDMQGEHDKQSNVGEQNTQGKSKGLDTITNYGNLEKADLKNKNVMIAESQPRLDNEQQAKKTATSNVQGIMSSKSEKHNGPKGSEYDKQLLASRKDVQQIGGIGFQHESGNDGKQDREDRMKELQPRNSKQLAGGNDGQQPKGSDLQQPNGSDGQQPKGGDGHQPSGSEGDNLAEVKVNNPAEMTGTNPPKVTGNNLADAMGNNLTGATGKNLHEVTGNNLEEGTGTKLMEGKGNNLTAATGNNLPEVTDNNLAEATRTNLPEATGNNLMKATGNNLTEGTGTNLSEVRGNNLAEATGNNLTEAAGTNLQEAMGNNLTEATGNHLMEATGNNLTEAMGTNLPEATGNDLADATGNNLTGVTDTNLPEAMDNNPAETTGTNLPQETGNNLTSDGQKPNGSDGHQPSKSDGQQP